MSDTPIRLLLVDDEAGFVDVLYKRLTRRGLEVVTALSGESAIQALRKQDFDVCVLDLKMEDMDGIEVLKIFKKMAPELPIIFLTGHGSEQAAIEGMRFGAKDYLMKPCDLETLLARVLDAAQRE
ncbi:response regulator [Desulfovibrio ferrophilus]|uniref:Response regulator with CheY-like receiver n=1 Tax=Desulfovibrio ferrophilus TaxID=241368 RepID=A0A2Z6B0L1_9BACT|nr:response regulator [Desulfovibrio ferrophilus]BBD09067.1 response regulator with CheY-like receiver [Desulfovibrio ferrophilus]